MHIIFAKKQRGLSLVELMVSIVIGLVLVTGIIQVFISSKQTYSTQQELGRLQENIRFSHEFLSRDLRVAGFSGCLSIYNGAYISVLDNTSTDPDNDWNFTNPIIGINNVTATQKIDTEIAPNKDTDVLILRLPVGDAVDVTSDTNSTQLYVKDTNTPGEGCSDGASGFCSDDTLLISDCTNPSLIFQASTLTKDSKGVKIAHVNAGAPGNDLSKYGGENGLGTNFGLGSQVTKYQTVIYYIGTTDQDEPALFKRTGTSGVGNQLIEGVEDMQIEYGVDASPNNSRTYQTASYKTAAAITAANEWDKVVSLRITLLVRSKANLLDTAEKKEIANGVAIGADRRMRQLANFTIGLRSRLK